MASVVDLVGTLMHREPAFDEDAPTYVEAVELMRPGNPDFEHDLEREQAS